MTEPANIEIANWPEGGLEPHPYAAIFRMLDDTELAELADRIAANGLRESIVMYEGKILDGRNRYLACLKAGVIDIKTDWRSDPHFVAFGGMGWDPDRGFDPLEFVWDTNAARRHDSPAQRSMAAARYANARQGQRTDLVEDGGEPSANLRPVVTQAEAAEKLGVSERSVSSAEAVIKHGAPELVDAVDKGLLAVSTAAEVAALPAEEQKEIVAAGDKKAVREAAKKATEKPGEIAVPAFIEPKEFGSVVTVHIGGFGKYGDGSVSIRAEMDGSFSVQIDYSYRLRTCHGRGRPLPWQVLVASGCLGQWRERHRQGLARHQSQHKQRHDG
ncbi:Plasmid replication/partition related protein [Devosia sp. H5989]|nr:Plasmid replication/partition related protein [Devosia sp. H5989]